MAAEADPNASELMALLERLNSSLDAADQTLRPAVSAPSPEEALGLYFVAARLVELQLRLLERDDDSPLELAREVAVTRDVLVGTRSVLRAALAGVAMEDGDLAATVAAPKLRVVNGGRALL